MKTMQKIWKKMSTVIFNPHHSDSIYVSSDEYSRLFYQPTDFKYYR